MTNERAYVEGKEIVCETKRLYIYKREHLGKTYYVVALKNFRVGDLGYYYSKATAIREMKEETGIDYEIDHLAVICENFFDGHGGIIDGLDCHCLELYFVMKSKGITDLVSESINADGNTEELVWIPTDKIEQYNIKPSFLRERIKEIINGDSVLHIVTDADRQ